MATDGTIMGQKCGSMGLKGFYNQKIKLKLKYVTSVSKKKKLRQIVVDLLLP